MSWYSACPIKPRMYKYSITGNTAVLEKAPISPLMKLAPNCWMANQLRRNRRLTYARLPKGKTLCMHSQLHLGGKAGNKDTIPGGEG